MMAMNLGNPGLTVKAATRSPSPRNGPLLIPTGSVGCAGSTTGQRLSLHGEGAQLEDLLPKASPSESFGLRCG